MPTKKCFVISPIGAPETAIREAADDVFDFIIKPALDGLEIEAVRADKLADPGLITEQMLAAILNYDLCIADLSGHNPNVFYELAIAQAAERPVVILKRAGDLIPFDVKDYRLIEYDLKPRSIKTDKWIPIVQEQVRRVTAKGYTAPRFLRGRSISKSESIRSYLISARSQEFGDPPRYFDVVEQAHKYCYLMGVSLKSWANENARSVLQNVTSRGVDVKVLIIDEAHPGLAAMINPRLPSEDLDVVKRQTTKMAEHFLAIAKTMTSFEIRRLRHGLPHFQLIVTDSTALVLQYMYSRGTADSPLQQFPAGTPLHLAFKEEFDALWALNQ